ncbi:hypothetical protein ABIE00_002536 [Arthrobacter sp. OAP107]
MPRCRRAVGGRLVDQIPAIQARREPGLSLAVEGFAPPGIRGGHAGSLEAFVHPVNVLFKKLAFQRGAGHNKDAAEPRPQSIIFNGRGTGCPRTATGAMMPPYEKGFRGGHRAPDRPLYLHHVGPPARHRPPGTRGISRFGTRFSAVRRPLGVQAVGEPVPRGKRLASGETLIPCPEQDRRQPSPRQLLQRLAAHQPQRAASCPTFLTAVHHRTRGPRPAATPARQARRHSPIVASNERARP